VKTKNKHQEYQYLNLMEDVLKNGVVNVDRGTGVKSLSVFGRQCRYDLSKDFPLLTTKKVYWKGVLHELYWFMSGQSNIKYLVDNNVKIWDDYPYKAYKKLADQKKVKELTKDEFIEKIRENSVFAKKWGNLPRIYGELWRRWPTKRNRTVDQLKWVISELKEDPFARNAIVTSWNPEYLYKMAVYEDTSHFPICHNMYQVSIKNGRLSLQLYQRSADLFLGVPFNIASYSLLVLILAQVLGYKPGEFIHTLGDAHIYENHIKQVKEQLKRKPRPFPKVSFSKKIKDIDKFRPEQVILSDYNPHPMLTGELTVAGGYFEEKKKKTK